MSYTPSITSTPRYATIDVDGQRLTYPASSATINGIAAPIKGNNELKASNTPAGSSWTKTRASIGATTTATLTSGEVVTLHKLVEDGTVTNTHLISQVPVCRADLPVVARVVIKQVDAARNGIRVVVSGDSGSSNIAAIFNAEAGTVTSSAGTGAGVVAGTAITSLGGSCYECVLRGTVSVTANNILSGFDIQVTNDSNSQTYSGDSTSSIYIAQMQLTQGTAATTYGETTSQVIGGDGNGVLQSGNLANASWSKEQLTGVSAGSIAYTNAATLTTGEVLSMAGVYETVTSAQHSIHQTSDINANAPITASIIVKGINRDYVWILALNASAGADVLRATYRFSTGVVSSITNGGTASGCALTAEVLGDSAVRLTLKGTPSTAAGVVSFRVYTLNDSASSSYAGEVTKGVYIAEPVIVSGSVAPTYIRTYANSMAAGGSSKSRAYVRIPDLENFDDAGTHKTTPWYDSVEWAVTDGTDTGTDTDQFTGPTEAYYGSVGAGPYAYRLVGVEPGDTAYVHPVSGTGIPSPETLSYTPTTPSVIWIMAFSDALRVWLAKLVVTLTFETGGVRKPTRQSLRRSVRVRP